MRSLPRFLFGCLLVALLALGFTHTQAQTTSNLLRGGPTATNPLALPVELAVATGAAFYGTPDLTAWTGSWQAPQALYDQGASVDSEDFWDTTVGVNAGTTWMNSATPGAGIGILVIDLQQERTLDHFSVFQMFSDGKATHIQFFRHSAIGATPPLASDSAWSAVAAESVIDAGLNDMANNRIANPTKITVPAFTTRYLRIAVRNDGRYLSPGYIELKGVKAFYTVPTTPTPTTPTATPTTPTNTATPTPTATAMPTPTATPVPSGCTQGVVGTIQADNGFCPDRDGFAFGNFGDSLDPGAATLIDMYGADAVCKRGTLTADGTACTVDVSVRALIASHQRTTYGNAYGMSVTSLRLFTAQDEQPALFDPTASTSFALPFSSALASYINRFSAQQFSVRTGAQGDSGYLRALLPESLLARITAELQRPRATANPLLLLLYARDGASSHTLVPYRLVDVGGNQFDLYVYDANFPGDNNRKVRFDLAAATWSYSTTFAALNKTIDLSGDSTSSALPDLRYLSAHAMRGLVMLGTSAALTTTNQTLLATGNPMAYETNNCHDLSIGGTVVTTMAQSNPGCNAVANTGNYQSLAFSDGFSAEDSNRSQNRIAGVGGANTASGDLTFDLAGNQGSGGMQLDLLTDQGDLTQISAAPAGVSSAGIASTTALSYGLKLSPDASTVSMSATGPAGATTAVVANLDLLERGRTANQPSIRVTVQGIPLALGQPLQTNLDATTGLFTLTSDRPIVVALLIERLAPDGSTATFENSNVFVDGVAAQLNFGAWTGGRTPLSIVVDKSGDGFANDTPQTLENRYGRVYLPIVRMVR